MRNKVIDKINKIRSETNTIITGDTEIIKGLERIRMLAKETLDYFDPRYDQGWSLSCCEKIEPGVEETIDKLDSFVTSVTGVLGELGNNISFTAKEALKQISDAYEKLPDIETMDNLIVQIRVKDAEIMGLREDLLRIDAYCRVNDIDIQEALDFGK